MSLLPNAHKAVVPLEKLADYSLNPSHPTGRHKARVFRSRLGLTRNDAAFLRNTLLQIVLEYQALQEDDSLYGKRYVVDFMLVTSHGSAVVRSTWIVRENEDFPRLTSCFVR
jgi:hypothetical protein